MFPQTLKVKPNTTVTFTMSKDTREVHTATFGPASVLKTLSDGFGGVDFPSQGLYPSDPASIVVSPTSHGDGFGNTGALDQEPGTPQIPPSNKIDFTTPGTYHFQCLIPPLHAGDDRRPVTGRKWGSAMAASVSRGRRLGAAGRHASR